jgi:hypothetical protein
MPTINLDKLTTIDGFIAACLADSDSGMALAKAGGGFDLDLAAAGNSEVIKSKRRVAAGLALNDLIEDILITLGRQYHLIRPLERNPTLFLYLALDRSRANLAMARHELRTFERTLDFN